MKIMWTVVFSLCALGLMSCAFNQEDQPEHHVGKVYSRSEFASLVSKQF